MKSAKVSGILALAVLASIASPYTLAEAGGWYIGANAGQSRAKIDDSRITDNLLNSGFVTTSISNDNRDTGYKIFSGYQLNEFLSVEGGYFDLGRFGYTATTLPPGTLSGNIKLRGVNLDVIGMLPISEKFSAFGRVGVNYAEARDSFTGSGAVNVLDPNQRKRDTNLKFGLGVQYDFTQSLGMRVEAERYRINDAVGNKGDIDLISLGLIYRFGG